MHEEEARDDPKYQDVFEFRHPKKKMSIREEQAQVGAKSWRRVIGGACAPAEKCKGEGKKKRSAEKASGAPASARRLRR